MTGSDGQQEREAGEFRTGDAVSTQAGFPVSRRERDEPPQWVGPFGARASDAEMRSALSPPCICPFGQRHPRCSAVEHRPGS